MKTNQEGLDLIKRFEGFRAAAYKCPAGVWTIGYGHTSAAGEPRVSAGNKITLSEGEEILKSDLIKYENAVIKALNGTEVTSNQFSALVSLCYNIGAGALAKSSIIRGILKGDISYAADRFRAFNRGGGRVLNGLVRRREAERELFLKS